mmetsp:Transcript_10659/g.21473  ORF Transcript_10659/g.21473 Transcript_10659/m.21473 type:complete len:86 (+) Transcript_10659:1670-1927(+)
MLRAEVPPRCEMQPQDEARPHEEPWTLGAVLDTVSHRRSKLGDTPHHIEKTNRFCDGKKIQRYERTEKENLAARHSRLLGAHAGH